MIGNTPLIKITNKIFAKMEAYNPSGSIKDRMANYILLKAREAGLVKPGDTIVEATSGNTGIAFAMLGTKMGCRVKIIMPRNMSEERKQMMRIFGAEIIEVGDNAFLDAIALRDKLASENEDYFSPRQFSNPHNIECHRETTGREILEQMDHRFDALITGSGTGGTLMGCHQAFLQGNCPAKIIQVQPEESNSEHGIQGINDGKDFLLDPSIVDEVIYIKTQEAIEKAKAMAKSHGLLIGISSGANILAAERWVKNNRPKMPVVTFICDRGERYMSLYAGTEFLTI